MPLLPSMEPPPFGDGKLRHCLRRSSKIDHLQWSHRLSAMERSSCQFGIGIRACLQWSHRLSAMERPAKISDGAGGLRLQWSHRLSAMERTFRQKVGGEAMILQWSHRLSAMESWKPCEMPLHQKSPSMEPPPFGDGKRPRRPKPQLAPGPSMEPPPFGDGKTTSTPAAAETPTPFNGATAFRRWKV